MDINRLSKSLGTEQGDSPSRPPLHLWWPEEEGEIDIRIAADGKWYHEGRVIPRENMVKLFASILRLEGNTYYLVTPECKMRIQVDDAPFVATQLYLSGDGVKQELVFVTNVGDEITADSDHPIVCEISDSGEPRPYLLVRDDLRALINRNVYYQLADLAESQTLDGERWWGVWSRGEFFRFDKVSVETD
jgi:hypothetical protein